MSPLARPVAARLRSWYADAARELPWRQPGTPAWGVLVSEVMLQQTPVSRVLPAYSAWLARWPTPAALAAAPAGEAVRQWGRLGYPRRALALHAAATAIADRHGGLVPGDLDALLALPGVGAYTARAVAAFAFGARHAVVDTNVRRVITRHQRGLPPPARGAPSTADLALVESLLPPDGADAKAMSVALMELGALICTARQPRCGDCPIATDCAWRAAGAPAGAERRPQTYIGTDRQARGVLLGVLRDTSGPVDAATLIAAWPDPVQGSRALAGLAADGLAVSCGDARYSLPD